MEARRRIVWPTMRRRLNRQGTRRRKELQLIVISLLTRRLRDGKTYEDFREAWLPEQGFGFPTRVVSAQSVEDDREVITIGFSELDEAEAEAQLQRIGPDQQRRHDKIDFTGAPGQS
jgi:hypothetical protein